MSSLEIRPCSHFNLVELAQIFTDSFAGYSIPIALDAESLALRIRREQIDLHRSVVLYQGAQPVGIALLGIRGDRYWCGGFGILAPFRGRGLAKKLWCAMLHQVKGHFSLEVLATNQVALDFYLKQGMIKQRELLILEGEGGGCGEVLRGDPFPLILKSERLWRPAWQRDIPTLLTLVGLQAYADPEAYIVLDPKQLIVDAGARSREAAASLIAKVSGPLRLVNEPEESYFSTVLPETGRQYELTLP